MGMCRSNRPVCVLSLCLFSVSRTPNRIEFDEFGLVKYTTLLNNNSEVVTTNKRSSMDEAWRYWTHSRNTVRSSNLEHPIETREQIAEIKGNSRPRSRGG